MLLLLFFFPLLPFFPTISRRIVNITPDRVEAGGSYTEQEGGGTEETAVQTTNENGQEIYCLYGEFKIKKVKNSNERKRYIF